MKTSTLKRGGRNTPLPLGLILGAALLCGLASEVRAQNDPSGDWDLVVSGSQQGVAFLTFNKDTTITGFEVITSYTPPESADGRGLDFNNDRNVVSSGGSLTNHYLFGLFPITGNWNFDSKGRTIGFITEGDDVVKQGSSFIATVKPGRRITMKVLDSPDPTLSSSKPRQRIYKGIPLDVTDDVSGDFYANGIQNSRTNGFEQQFTEFFNLSSADPAIFPEISGSPASANAYFLAGSGPGYTNFGLAVFSGQMKMSIASIQSEAGASNGILRSVAGGFNVRSGINGAGKLLGTDENASRINYKVKRF